MNSFVARVISGSILATNGVRRHHIRTTLRACIFQKALVCLILRNSKVTLYVVFKKGPSNGDNDNAPSTLDDIREEMSVTDLSAHFGLDFFAKVYEGESHHGDDSDSENNSESESESDDDSNNHDEYEKSHLTKN